MTPPDQNIPLNELKTLDILPGGSYAIRDLDEEHVEHLVLSDARAWPAILVTKVEQNYILIDGYHRVEAGHQKGLTTLVARIQHYDDTNAIIEAAFQANLRHGLKASEGTRGDYAYWLFLSYPELTQVEIAARAGISQPAVSKAIAKREELLREEASEEQPVLDQKSAKKESKRFVKQAIAFASLSHHIDDDELRIYLDKAVKTIEDRERLKRLAAILYAVANPLEPNITAYS